MKKYLLLTLVLVSFVGRVAFAVEAPLYFGDEKYPVKQNTLLLDSDDTTGDILVQFGNTLNKIFQWDDNATDIGGDTSGLFAFLDGVEIYENNTNVGIGTGLTISQAGTGDAILQFLLNSVQRWVVGIDNSDSYKFKIASATDLASSPRLTIQTTGEVGIGTTTPGAQLSITPATANALRINPYGAVAGNTGELQFRELAANGTNHVGFKAPDNIATDRIWTLPAADGASGQLISTNGSGALSWATPSSVLSALTAATAANSINNGDNAQTWNWQLTTASKKALNLNENTASTGAGSTILNVGTLAASTATPLYVSNYGAANSFRVDDVAADATPFVIDPAGKVGIGTNSPSANLDVYTTDGVTRIGEAFPNKSASTDNGIAMYNATTGNTFKSGLFTEVDGGLLSYGINVSQIGDRDTTKTGAIFRMDTRATSPYFSVKRQAIGGSTEYSDIQISQAGDVGMGGYASDTNVFPGQLSVLSRAAAVPGLIVTGAASQTANLCEWRDNAGTPLSSINSAGALTIGQSGTAITRHLSNTASLDFPATNNNCSNLTITVTGAAVGDSVVATPTPVASGVETFNRINWNAYVSAANTVTVRICSTNNNNPAAQTWRVDVWQH